MKWILIGRRCPGVYPYDESSYCQRWEQYKTKAQMNMDSLGLLGGSWWMVQYYRFLGANIGRDACLYPWGASPGLTEPDLVTLGDRVNVEDVALVAHTNTMGGWSFLLSTWVMTAPFEISLACREAQR